MSFSEMPIFTRTFDLLAWLLPLTNHFPRSFRHSFTQRLLDAAFDLRERLDAANQLRGLERNRKLVDADEVLARMRLYLRLAHRLKWMTDGQYRHVAVMETEIGKLLGEWRKATASRN